MAPTVTKFGPGVLEVGEVGSEIDFSCQVEYAQLAVENSKDEDVTTLCGDTVPGAVTRTASLSGHMFQDTGDPAGIVMASWTTLMGQQVPFKFVPATVDGVQWPGVLTVEPITVGSSEAGANMASDFDWACVGVPVPTAIA